MEQAPEKMDPIPVFRIAIIFLYGSFLFPSHLSWALGPIHSFHDLVAGQGDPGRKDGFFADAQFHSPTSLTLSSDNHFLYVADQDNHCIRAIDFTKQNEVSTLAGCEEPGHLDGPLTVASFNKPYRILEISPDRLLVYDIADESFRLLDLSQKTVSTLVRSGDKETHGLSLAQVDEVVFDPSTQSLYFTQSLKNVLRRLDLGTHDIQVLLDHSSQVPQPRALCLWQGRLLVADRELPSVFQVTIPTKNQTPADLIEITQGKSILGLIPSGKNLYAFQKTDPPFVCLKPIRNVDFPFVWDTKIQWDKSGQHPPSEYWFPFQDDPPVCFISDPREQWSFLLAIPSRNEIVSFRDLAEKYSAPTQWMGFRPYGHPPAKPKDTVRILVVADPLLDSGALPGGSEPSHALPSLATAPQRLELMLNTEAALKGWNASFEVMAFDSSGALIPIAQTYDIDLVLCLESSSHSLPSPDWVEQSVGQWQKTGHPASAFQVAFLPGTAGVAIPSVEEDRAFWTGFCREKNISFLDLTRDWTLLRPSFFPLGEDGPQPKLNVKGADLLGGLLARRLLIADLTPEGALKPFTETPETLEPLRQFTDLVAGEGAAGFREGDFASALFHSPTGLALSADGSDLYVADPGNHRIRVIHLEHSNEVETLSGNDESGNRDGPLNQASFEQPTLLAAVPQGLVVYDAQKGLLREINSKSGSVSTLPLKQKGQPVETGRLSEVFNMVYDTSSDALYLSEPTQGRLDMISFKTLELTVLLEKDSRSPQPAAMTLFHGNLCLSDLTLPGIRTVTVSGSPEEKKTSLTPLWNGSSVCAMAALGDCLYALAGSPVSWIRVDTEPTTRAMSIWETLLNPVPFDFSAFLGGNNGGEPVGLITGGKWEQKLFLTSPTLNQVFCLSDDDFKANPDPYHPLPDGVPDYQYPPHKPEHTFRIMITGDSHVFRNDFGNNNMENLAKRLQIFLNTEASLEGSPTHFEVINYAFGNGDDYPPFLWNYYLDPDVVKKYDIDLVLMGMSSAPSQNFRAYYQRPLTSEGIPAWKQDPEFLLKSFKEQLPSGREGDIFRRHLRIVAGGKDELDGLDMPGVLADRKDQADIVFLYSKPIALLRKKLSSMQTSQGQPVALGMFFFPAGSHGNLVQVEPFRKLWGDVAGMAGIPYLDLAAPFTALRQSYFPVAEFASTFHQNSGGYFFKGYLLAQKLIQEKIIPFQPSSH